MGLPAWGLLLTRCTGENRLHPVQLLKFLGLLVLGLLVLGLAMFTFNAIYPFFSPGLFLLPVIPLIRLSAHLRSLSGWLQAAVEILLAVAAVWLAFAVPTPEGSWSSPWAYAGGAATVSLMISFWARCLACRSRRLWLNDGAVV